MKIQYLGTAAAEGFPGMFCCCETCEKARKAGGKNIRTRSQAIIDDLLLIDFPADTYMHTLLHNIPLQNIEHCIVTHAHSDHFYAADLEMRRIGFATLSHETPLHIYGGQAVFCQASEDLCANKCQHENRVIPHIIRPFQSFNVLEYTITALPADHDPKASSLVYIIQKDGQSILYAHDTGLFDDAVWRFLEEKKIRFDFVSLDCTAGLLKGWTSGHLGLDTCMIFRDRLRAVGAIDDRTLLCLNHFSHNCLATYDELLPVATEHEFDVSYDGKIITI
ncbi:MAG: MBL fold metallo-hydrolase [Clostridia bacterium]|nr:MBL fold metallo-hydrolase [Clostridia bacterium]